MLLRIPSRRSLLLSPIAVWWTVQVRPYLMDRCGESVRDRHYRLSHESRLSARQTGKLDSIGPAHCPELVTARCGVPDRPAGVYRDSIVRTAGYRRAQPAVSVIGYTEPVGLSDSTDRLPSSASLRQPLPATVIRREIAAAESEVPGLFREVYDQLTDTAESISIHSGPVSPDWHPEDVTDRAHGDWRYRWEPRSWARIADSDPEFCAPLCRIGSHIIRTPGRQYVCVSLEFLSRCAYKSIQRELNRTDRHDAWMHDRILELAEDIAAEAAVRWTAILRSWRKCPPSRRKDWRGKVCSSPFMMVRHLTSQWFRAQTRAHQAEVALANKPQEQSVRSNQQEYHRRLAAAMPMLSDRASLIALALLSGDGKRVSDTMRATDKSVRQAIRTELARVVESVE